MPDQAQKKTIQLLVTLDGENARVIVRRLVGVNYFAGEILVDGRSLTDAERAIEAAALESQGRPTT